MLKNLLVEQSPRVLGGGYNTSRELGTECGSMGTDKSGVFDFPWGSYPGFEKVKNLKQVYSTFPEWINYLNFDHWLDRTQAGY